MLKKLSYSVLGLFVLVLVSLFINFSYASEAVTEKITSVNGGLKGFLFYDNNLFYLDNYSNLNKYSLLKNKDNSFLSDVCSTISKPLQDKNQLYCENEEINLNNGMTGKINNTVSFTGDSKLIDMYNDYIYYRSDWNSDNGRLYKIKKDGTNKTYLGLEKIYGKGIIFDGNILGVKNGNLSLFSTTGGNLQQISNEYIKDIGQTDKYVFYLNGDSELKRFNKETKNIYSGKILEYQDFSVSNFVVGKYYIYYSATPYGESNFKIYKADFNFNNKEVIYEGEACGLKYNNNQLYFLNKFDCQMAFEGDIYSLKLTEKIEVNGNTITEFNKTITNMKQEAVDTFKNVVKQLGAMKSENQKRNYVKKETDRKEFNSMVKGYMSILNEALQSDSTTKCNNLSPFGNSQVERCKELVNY